MSDATPGNTAPFEFETPPVKWARKLVDVRASEVKVLLLSFLYLFSLLCGYYIVRPLRDEMGIAGGVENLQWLFTGTFIVMLAAVPLFGWVISRYPRERFLPYFYFFFVANLLVFFALFRSGFTHAYVARAFFIWVSVYYLFVISVFWSFMADIYSAAQAKRLFGFIAAGGTAGALTGPILTATLAIPLGPTNLVLVSAAFLMVCVFCTRRLAFWEGGDRSGHAGRQARNGHKLEPAMGGSIWAGFKLVRSSPYLLGICLLILFLSTLATFLYFQQAEIVRNSFADPSQRTTVFAAMDLAVNALTITFQLLLTGRLVKRIGLPWTLALIPLLLGLGLVVLSFTPVLAVLMVVQVIRRAGNYAIMRPSREMLYSVLSKEEKYKAKNLIDTAVYRGGDAVSAWAYTGLAGLGLGLSAIALIAVPLAGLWAWISYALGRRRDALSMQTPSEHQP